MIEDVPFFSVIIPTYDRPLQLTTCVNALTKLNYPRDRFEVLVVDDGSPTSLREVVKTFGDAINVKLLCQDNTGPAGARNFGAAHATGDFLAFTDDDCEPEVNWLSAFANRFREDSRRVLGGRTINALEQNPYSATSQLIIDVVYEHFNNDEDGARFFASNNFAVSAEVFQQLKGFDAKFLTSEDRDFCARAIQRGIKLSYAPDAVIKHAHQLTLSTLWRQHYNYGRGAMRFHRARKADDGASFKPDYRFYSKLLQASTSLGLFRSVQRSVLLFWSQLANAAGFFYEGLRKDSYRTQR